MGSFGHTYYGVKWQILPLCLKRKFYTNHAFVHKGKILCQGCSLAIGAKFVYITTAFYAIEFGVKP